MDIVKRLILNKTPKDLPNASIACAKNIMIDDTGSFITNDIGFKVSFETEDENEYIVGVIPCNKEIVIFTYNYQTSVSKVYRKPDIGENTIVDCGWSWSGGKITGSYTYNYKNELIIAVGEYDADNNKVPLKSFNLDTCEYTKGQTYAIEENIPAYKATYDINEEGSLLCGVYTLFIRFKVDNYNFTKWFQISGDINIIQEALTRKYVHNYLDADDVFTKTFADSVNVNNNKISNKSVSLELTFSDNTLSKFQLGYIFKRNSDIVGRLQGEYDIIETVGSNTASYTCDIDIINNNFVEEISVDTFLETPHQFYNVKNVINYNNRLYIANYEEYGVEDLTEASSNVKITVQDIEGVSLSRPTEDTISWTFNLDLYQYWFNSRGTKYSLAGNKIPFSNIITDNNGYVADKEAFINQITQYLCIAWEGQNKIMWNDTDVSTVNLYWLIQKKDSNIKSDAICLARKINNNTVNEYLDSNYCPIGVGWDFLVENYNIKLVLGDGVVKPTILIEYNNKTWTLINHNGDPDALDKTCIFAYYDNNITRGYVLGSGIDYTTAQQCNVVNSLPNLIESNISDISNSDSTHVTPDTPGGDGDISGGDNVSATGPNVRTLHPYQTYNFFIHYIRIDGSYTLGFPITPNNVTYKLSSGKNVIRPKFEVSNPDSNNYVGYFITYEDVESTVDSVYIDSTTTTPTAKTVFTNALYLYDINTIRGDKLVVNGEANTLNKESLKYIENRLTFNHIEYNASIAHNGNRLAYLLKSISNLYNKKVKTLYRLTENIYFWGSYIPESYYLPAFYDRQVIVEYMDADGNGYPKQIIADPATEYVFDFVIGSTGQVNDGIKTKYSPNIIPAILYSEYPTSAMNIKQDFQLAAISLDGKVNSGDSTKTTDVFTNVVISPDKLHDFLEFKAAYTAKPSKSYTNYNKDNISIFDKTIYRSDIVSDESLVNGFRHFNINNYRNILENKGNITNIVGIGLYLIVHTEYSMFVFDRSPKLTVTAQTEIPDAFDIKYQEVMSSNEGFGGLLDKEESIVTKNGYIWYDRTNAIIFKYENGKASILSTDINNYIKANNIRKVRFAEDIIHNRLIICFEVLKQGIPTYFTLSYSFYTNSFISAHDYKFTENYRTYSKSYVFDKSVSNKLFEFDDDSISDYLDLQYTDLYNFFPVYKTDSNNKVETYVDIIFNSSYELCNTLEYIRYVLNAIQSKNTLYNVVEEHLNRRYSGDRLRIYTDETNSEDLDILVNEDDLNNPNQYKLPHFEKGSWILNYFRNKINVQVTNDEVIRTIGRATINNETRKLARSDNKSLIYGKYFVIRFIFDNTERFKLDSLQIQTNAY